MELALAATVSRDHEVLEAVELEDVEDEGLHFLLTTLNAKRLT
jgi:hypothetical protein